jgi:hypothetical protein
MPGLSAWLVFAGKNLTRIPCGSPKGDHRHGWTFVNTECNKGRLFCLQGAPHRSVTTQLWILMFGAPSLRHAGLHIKSQYWQIPLLVRRGGRATRKRSRSETARTGWSLTHPLSKRILEMGLVSDHPVCGASVASRLFINAAATPPHEEGNVPESATLCAKPRNAGKTGRLRQLARRPNGIIQP